MPQIYTLVAYRRNHTDYCRGCDMGRSNSDLEMLTSDDEAEIISWWSDKILFNLTKDRDYASYEVTVIKHRDDLWEDEYPDYFEENASLLANEKFDEQERLNKEQEEIKKAKQKRQQEISELKELARLEAKYKDNLNDNS